MFKSEKIKKDVNLKFENKKLYSN